MSQKPVYSRSQDISVAMWYVTVDHGVVHIDMIGQRGRVG